MNFTAQIINVENAILLRVYTGVSRSCSGNIVLHPTGVNRVNLSIE